MTPIAVTEAELLANPARFHDQLVVVVGTWTMYLEHSRFAKAWLSPPDAYRQYPNGVFRVRVTGYWRWVGTAEAEMEGGFGHFGLWPGELRAVQLEVIEILRDGKPIDDQLTGLLNRRGMQGVFENLQATGKPLLLAMLDVDGMKIINDTHGHDAGDEILRRCATTLVQTTARKESSARWGGDEFVILLPDETEATAVASCRRFVNEVRSSDVSFSAAVITVAPIESLDVAIKRASWVLSQAKLRGGGHVLVESDTKPEPPAPPPRPDTFRHHRASNTNGKALTQIEWVIGAINGRSATTLNVGAAAGDNFMLVVDGVGGHPSDWLGARLAARRIAENEPHAEFVGAANALPTSWGWGGGLAEAEGMYAACAADFTGPRPPTLPAMFHDIERVLELTPTHGRTAGALVGCIVATFDGTRVHGAHAGVGRARVYKRSPGMMSERELVTPHYLDRVASRMPELGAQDPEALPANVVVNGIGSLSRGSIGVDEFDVELSPGDVLFVTSGELEFHDAFITHCIVELDDKDLDAVADKIEKLSNNNDPIKQRDVAFAIARLRPPGRPRLTSV